MVSVVRNADVKQKDAAHAVAVAVFANAMFDTEAEEAIETKDALEKGTAFSFIKAIQAVNERLLDKNPDETLLFDVILLSNDSDENNSRIIASVKHYEVWRILHEPIWLGLNLDGAMGECAHNFIGCLDIGRFCFCNKEDSIESLQSNNVKLFVSTDTNDVCEALQKGIPSALLYRHTAQPASDKLKVLFSGDALGFSQDTLDGLREQGFSEPQLQSFKAAKVSMKEFAMLMGEMRRKFTLEDSPLCTSLITEWGCRDMCASALKTLRGWGLMVDEAFCLTGAPRSPILTLVQPHILCLDGLAV